MVIWITLLSFLLGVLSPPWVQASLWNERQKTLDSLKKASQLEALLLPAFQPDPSSLENSGVRVPEALGTVTGSWSPDSSAGPKRPLVIHIQDVHRHYGAQRNLAGILNHLANSYRVSGQPLRIYIEGAWEDVNTDFLGALPDEGIRERTADALLRQDKITGEEYLSVVSPGILEISGIENKELYQANVGAAQKAQGPGRARLAQIRSDQERLAKLKKTLYPADLLDLDRLREDYRDDRISINEYVVSFDRKFNRYWNPAQFPEISNLLDISALEDELSAGQAEKERQGIVEAVQRGGYVGVASRLLRVTLDHRVGRIDSHSYYETLLACARSLGVPAPNLEKMSRQQGAFRNFKYENLTEEIKRLEEAILSGSLSGIGNDDERVRIREVWSECKRLDLAAQFIEHKVSSREWFNSKSESESVGSERLRFYTDSYYDLALRRDEAMVENLISKLPIGGSDFPKAVVLIAGGYHSEGITRRLKEKGYPYMVIQPSLNVGPGGFPSSDGAEIRGENLKTSYLAGLEKLVNGNAGPSTVKEALRALKGLVLAGPFDIQGKIFVFGECPQRTPHQFAMEFSSETRLLQVARLKSPARTLRPRPGFAQAGMAAQAVPLAMALGRAGPSVKFDGEVPMDQVFYEGMKIRLRERADPKTTDDFISFLSKWTGRKFSILEDGEGFFLVAGALMTSLSLSKPTEDSDPWGIGITHPDLKKWVRILSNPAPLGGKERAGILNIARSVVNSNFLRAKTLGRYLNDVGSASRQLALLSMHTADRLLTEAQSPGIDGGEAFDSIQTARELLKLEKYTLEYRHSMTAPSNYIQFASYGLPGGGYHPRLRRVVETVLKPFSWIVQYMWGFKFGMFNARIRFFSRAGDRTVWARSSRPTGRLERLMEAGNQAEKDLYPDPAGLRLDLERQFEHLKIQTAEYDNQLTWPWRKIISRVLGLSFVVLILEVAITAFDSFVYAVPFSYTFANAFSAILRGLVFSMVMSWLFILLGMSDRFYTSQRRVIARQEARLKEVESAIFGERGMKESWLQSEYRKILQSPQQEMNIRTADIILLVTPPGQKETGVLMKNVDSFKGSIHPDVPVVPVSSRRPGSGSGFLEAVEYLNSPAYRKLALRVPHLKGKSHENLRILVLLADDPAVASVATPLRLPLLDRPMSPLEFSFRNGLRGTQALAKEGKGGLVAMFSDEIFISPFNLDGDLTLLGFWANYDELVEQNLDLMVADVNGSHTVNKLYLNSINSDPAYMKNKVERASLLRRYDLNNRLKRQLLTYAGGFVVGFKNEDRAKKFLNLASKVHQKAESGRHPRLPIDLERHFLAPLVIGANSEDLSSYLAKHRNGSPMKSTEWSFYSRLMETFEKFGGLTVTASVPHPKQSAFYFARAKDGVPVYDKAQIDKLWHDLGERLPEDPPHPDGSGSGLRATAGRLAVWALLVLSSLPVLSAYSVSRLEKLSSDPALMSSLSSETQIKIRKAVLNVKSQPSDLQEKSRLLRNFWPSTGVPAEKIGRPRFWVVNLDGLVNETEGGLEFRGSLEEAVNGILEGHRGRVENPKSGWVIISGRPESDVRELMDKMGVPPDMIRATASDPQQASRRISKLNGTVEAVLSSREPGVLSEMRKYFGKAGISVLLSSFADMEQTLVIRGRAAREIYQGLKDWGYVSESVRYSEDKSELVLEAAGVKPDIAAQMRRVRRVEIQA